MHNGYAQAEGSPTWIRWPRRGADHDRYPKFQGVWRYARYVAICPPDWQYGITVGEVPKPAAQERQDPAMGYGTGRARSQVTVTAPASD